MPEYKKIVCIVVTVVLLIVAGGLIGGSIASLQPNELGLDYSANSLTIDTSKIYTAGVHFLGVGHRFIKYPKTILEIDMRAQSQQISGRTKDGLQIDLQTRLLYRLIDDVNSLASVYLSFKEDYPKVYRSIARGTIRDVAARYTAFEFWQQRDNITQVMKTELSTKLEDVHARVDDLLISKFALPSAFTEALTETDVWLQELNKVPYEKETAEKQIDTLLRTSNVTVSRMMVEARREANTTLLEYEAEVERIKVETNAELAAYTKLKERLGLTQEELVNIVWLQNLKHDVKKTFYVQQPAALQL